MAQRAAGQEKPPLSNQKHCHTKCRAECSPEPTPDTAGRRPGAAAPNRENYMSGELPASAEPERTGSCRPASPAARYGELATTWIHTHSHSSKKQSPWITVGKLVCQRRPRRWQVDPARPGVGRSARVAATGLEPRRVARCIMKPKIAKKKAPLCLTPPAHEEQAFAEVVEMITAARGRALAAVIPHWSILLAPGRIHLKQARDRGLGGRYCS